MKSDLFPARKNQTSSIALRVCIPLMTFLGLLHTQTARSALFSINDDRRVGIATVSGDAVQFFLLDGVTAPQSTPINLTKSSFQMLGAWDDFGAIKDSQRTVYFVYPATMATTRTILDRFAITTTADPSFGIFTGNFYRAQFPGDLGVVPAGTSSNDIIPANGTIFTFSGPPLSGLTVTAVAQIPEPGTLVLAAMGSIALLVSHRIRKHSAHRLTPSISVAQRD